MALYQYKKISLYRKNATVVLQVLQKRLSLLASGQEKKVCRYQSVNCVNASSQLRLNPSSATVGKLPTIQGHSQDKTLIAIRRIRTGMFLLSLSCLMSKQEICRLMSY